MNKAKMILLNEARKLRSKADQKRREASKFEAEAIHLEEKAEELK